MKFSDYKQNNTNDSKQSSKKMDKNAERLLRNFVKDYEGKSQSDIVAEIVKVAEKNRREGKLSDADLDNFANMLRPMLDRDQLKELDAIISRLKAQ